MTARVAVEQAGRLGWDRYTGATGATIVMHTFGASAPIAKLQAKFGFTVDNVVRAAREQVQNKGVRNEPNRQQTRWSAWRRPDRPYGWIS